MLIWLSFTLFSVNLKQNSFNMVSNWCVRAHNEHESTYHLEQGQIGIEYIVKVYLWILPCIILKVITHGPILHNGGIHSFAVFIDTFVEFTSEKLNPDDSKDKPEDKAYNHHIEDRWYGFYKGIHNHLKLKYNRT